MKNVAIVLAAGSGSRMNSPVEKQFLLLEDKPILYYSLHCFQESSVISEIVLVCKKEMIDYCKEQIVERYQFTKVHSIVSGGTERYFSVYEGLKAVEDCDYVFIHDGARPFVEENMLQRLLCEVQKVKACVAAMPVKDTIKRADTQGFAVETPERSALWQVQTPQVFEHQLIWQAYDRMIREEKTTGITDDAMVLERMKGQMVKLTEGSYQNIKVTTPEDMIYAESILKSC